MCRPMEGAKRSRIQIFHGGSNLSFASKMFKKESVLEKKCLCTGTLILSIILPRVLDFVMTYPLH